MSVWDQPATARLSRVPERSDGQDQVRSIVDKLGEGVFLTARSSENDGE